MHPKIVFLFIWWFAVVSNAGEATFFEYVKPESCRIFQKNYAKVHMKVTDCTWKDEINNDKSLRY